MAPTDPNANRDHPDELPDWLSDADSPGSLDLSNFVAPGEPAAASPPEPAPVSKLEHVAPATGVAPCVEPTPVPNRASTGEPFLYGAMITLGSKRAAGVVQIEHDVPPGLRILGTNPAISGTRGRTLIWRFGPGAITKQLPIRLKAVALDSTGPSDHGNAMFRVSRVTQFTSVVPVVRSSASVEFVGAGRFEIGSTHRATLKIKNTGNGLLRDVVVQLAADGVTVLGEPNLAFASIPAGGEVAANLQLTGSTAGQGHVRAELTARPATKATAELACEITAPKLEVSFTMPTKWRVNRDHSVTFSIRNAGTAAARMVDVWLSIPPGWDVKNPPEGYDPGTRLLFAHTDAIAEGSAFELSAIINPTLPGSGRFHAIVEDTRGRCEWDQTTTAEIDAAESQGILERFVKAVESSLEGEVEVPAAAAAAQRREHPHVIFAVADTEYAFPLHSVREIGRPPVSTPVPGSPDWLLGVANIRGDVVSMVDLRAFLDESPGPNTQDRRLLVVTSPSGDLSAGLLVDRVRGIRSIPPEQVRTPTAPINARCASYMAGVTGLDRRAIVVLVPDRLLLAPEFLPFGSS